MKPIAKFFVATLLSCASVLAAAQDDAIDMITPITHFACMEPAFQNTSGTAAICSSASGLSAKMRVSNLVPGDAYTVWWVYIDDPSQCVTPFQCAEIDFSPNMPSADPVVVLGRLDSGIAPASGTLDFGDVLKGMQTTAGSQVWYLVFGHGAADLSDRRQLARQLLTPEDPSIGLPHLGVENRPNGFPVGLALFVMP